MWRGRRHGFLGTALSPRGRETVEKMYLDDPSGYRAMSYRAVLTGELRDPVRLLYPAVCSGCRCHFDPRWEFHSGIDDPREQWVKCEGCENKNWCVINDLDEEEEVVLTVRP